jgi:hypothetical protein
MRTHVVNSSAGSSAPEKWTWPFSIAGMLANLQTFKNTPAEFYIIVHRGQRNHP